MERIKALINRLQEQVSEQAGTGQLKITAQLLLAELQQLEIRSKPVSSSAKVAVLMPSSMPANGHQTEATATPKEENIPVPEKKSEKKYQPSFPSLFENGSEVHAINGQNPARELHEVIGNISESLNDKLKEEKTEVASRISGSPIKDLKKAISLNDKFIFIKELFRGDEAMYERSLKTVNSFHILSEALYWIERELKIKLGWNNDDETVQGFMNLVKRRYT